jgi:hypothetical protein
MIEASCHCGAVKLQVPTAPEEVVSCNCSLCSRSAWLGAYYNPAVVNLITPRESIDTYIWGDRTIQICRCKTCGFTTHWESIDPQQTDRMGINARMMNDIDLDSIPVRYFDGASF